MHNQALSLGNNAKNEAGVANTEPAEETADNRETRLALTETSGEEQEKAETQQEALAREQQEAWREAQRASDRYHGMHWFFRAGGEGLTARFSPAEIAKAMNEESKAREQNATRTFDDLVERLIPDASARVAFWDEAVQRHEAQQDATRGKLSTERDDADDERVQYAGMAKHYAMGARAAERDALGSWLPPSLSDRLRHARLRKNSFGASNNAVHRVGHGYASKEGDYTDLGKDLERLPKDGGEALAALRHEMDNAEAALQRKVEEVRAHIDQAKVDVADGVWSGVNAQLEKLRASAEKMRAWGNEQEGAAAKEMLAKEAALLEKEVDDIVAQAEKEIAERTEPWNAAEEERQKYLRVQLHV